MNDVGRRAFVQQLALATGGLALGGAVTRLAAQDQFLSSVRLGDFDLYYEVHGDGPAVVFAHGAGGTHMSWWQQVPALSRHFRCITFDHRGFGYSRDVPNGPGRGAFVEDLKGLLDSLGIERASLVGQSMGGRTVLGFAAAYPERVQALVMCDTTGGYTDTELEEVREAAGSLGRRSAFAPAFTEKDPARSFLYREIQRLTIRDEDAPASAQTPIPDIQRIVAHEVPTLFMVGEEDSLVAPAVVEAMHRKMPGSQFVTVPGSGHSVYFEMPETFNRIVLEFLQQQS